MIRGNYRMWAAYQSPNFHPRQQDTSRSVRWLQDNQDRFSVVGRAT